MQPAFETCRLRCIHFAGRILNHRGCLLGSGRHSTGFKLAISNSEVARILGLLTAGYLLLQKPNLSHFIKLVARPQTTKKAKQAMSTSENQRYKHIWQTVELKASGSSKRNDHSAAAQHCLETDAQGYMPRTQCSSCFYKIIVRGP